MNRYKRIILLLITILGFPLWASADEWRRIRVDYEFSGTASSLRLYKNGILACENFTPTSIFMECDVMLTDLPMSFTMTSVSAAGTESQPSAPFELTLPPKDSFGNFIPTASFTADVLSGDAPLNAAFNASASQDIDGTITSYDWDFGDGGKASGPTVSHLFETPGVFTVTLAATDDANAVASVTQTVTVSGTLPSVNLAPTAVITATQIAETSIITFDASASSDPDGTISSYAWSFGDGASTTGISMDHEYIAAGDYTITLTVVDNEGLAGQAQLILTIVDAPPAPNELPVALITASAGKKLFQLAWDYGASQGLQGFRFYQNDRKTCETADPGSRQMECTTFWDEGLNEFYLTAYAADDTESTISNILVIDSTGIAPTASEGEAPFTIQFNGHLSYDPDGSITSYKWEFGDGSVATGPVATHAFTSAGNYNITLTVTDDQGEIAQATTEATILPPNNPPAASNQTLTIDQDSVATGTLSATDLDADPLSYAIVSNGSLGFAILTNTITGTFSYTPNSGVSGTDYFTFKANDGTDDSNLATVTITINKISRPPVANGSQLSTDEDTVLTGTLDATDPDGDSLTYFIASPPAKGTVAIPDNTSGAFSYTPSLNQYGTDSFIFQVNDGQFDSAPATVNITINAVNDAPTAAPDSAVTAVDTAVTINVLANDLDLDEDQLSIASVSQPANGSAVISGNSIVYTPAPGFSGTDTFTYTIDDSAGGTANGSVTVTVTATPSETQPTITVSWDANLQGQEIIGFRLSSGGVALCETSDPAARQLSCALPGGELPPALTLIGLAADGSENLTINITAKPTAGTTPQNSVTFAWVYSETAAAGASGFKMYINGEVACETTDPAARQLTCQVGEISPPATFTITVIDANGTESSLSNEINYAP